MSYIIYADLESLIKEMNGCKNYSENSSTTKIDKHSHYGYSVSTIWAFDGTENKYNVYRGEDCMTNFSKSLKENTVKTINFENDTINKREGWIAFKSENLLHLQKNVYRKVR